jgi:hypothetical protein
MSRLPRARALLGVTAIAAASLTAVSGAVPEAAADVRGSAATQGFALVKDRPVDSRLPQPEDRYAVAGGCYTVQAGTAGFVTRDGSALGLSRDAKAATPFHFQATRLGEYLLATNEGRDTSHPKAWWDVRGYAAAATPQAPLVGSLDPGLTVATAPSADAEWRLVAAGKNPEAKRSGQTYQLSVPSRDEVLAVEDGALALAPTGTPAAPLTLRHVRDDNPRDGDRNGTACASWPEIETGAVGRPQPAKGSSAQAVKGFFEAHVHGMAFEFLGGKVRCGRPWHPYGVEYALGDCRKDGNVYNGVLEVGLAGQSPTDPVTSYDPVGWPTFDYWPQHDTLTHEQFYWRWLERAYLGGLRLYVNLLVDNTALCQVFPVKKNSCNEMDGVRLQAQRLHELQDYIDAQSGGPGEGWLRIVTTPTEARRTINAGRLAVVLGIEVSELFDCREVLDQPQCTTQQIDDRLQEVFDMGVRQMELVNKFDNALSGVTGDGGTTGIVVNSGNKQVTQHYWDMRTCPEDVPHTHGPQGTEHDKTQPNLADDAVPVEGVDALAGRVLNEFGAAKGFAAPVYGNGPHCNSRGLTALGKHLIGKMVAKGMVFDPDHMSASAQRQALDFLEKELVPAERAAARREKRAPRVPALVSSHSWANDVVYQRIYQQRGVVAPRTGDAAAFADRWAVRKAWAKKYAPKDLFGLGYGADTNGLGGQPGARTTPKVPFSYARPWQAPIGGVQLRQQISGVRTYDINRDGVPHYGLFADWYREVQLAADEKHKAEGGGRAVLTDMLNAPEAYLRQWERGVYGAGSCVNDQSTLQAEDLHAALGLNTEGFLHAVGQPQDRSGDAYVYCVATAAGTTGLAEVTFDDNGRATGLQTRTAAQTAPTTSAQADQGGGAHRNTGVLTAPLDAAPAASTSRVPGGPAVYVGGLLLTLLLAGSLRAVRRVRPS